MVVRALGRDAELAKLERFLAPDARAAAIVLVGAPGIGKSTLWEAGIDRAREAGFRVLVARPSEPELQMSFAALADLLVDVDLSSVVGLPAPRRRALQVALLSADTDDPSPGPFAVCAGFMDVLRILCRSQPLLVAIDDVTWLDQASAEALSFAARRLRESRVRFLLTRRPTGSSGLERTLRQFGVERLGLGGLSVGAIRGILSDRLGTGLPRRVVYQIFESADGNPLFALEIGRMANEHGRPAIGRELPVPDDVEELLGTRVSGLPDGVRALLLATALEPRPRAAQLVLVAGAPALRSALDDELLIADGDRLRPAHPLLAAAARRLARPDERRELHRALAQAAVDEDQRARHLALAADDPDAGTAQTVAEAARRASDRGARQDAIGLAEHALRLTPAESAGRSERMLALAEYLEVAGERPRVTELLSPVLEALSPATARARACLLLAGGEVTRNSEIRGYHERALLEGRGDPALQAAALARIAANTAVIRVERIREAEVLARDALALVPRDRPDVERWALYALAWARALLGECVDELGERFRDISHMAFHVSLSPERIAGQRLVWRGELEAARSVLTRLLGLADEQGEPYSYALQRLHLCELELRAGNWDSAAALLDEWAESGADELPIWPMEERCRALLAAGRGLPEEAERRARGAIARAEAAEVRWDALEARRAGGAAALLAHEPARAAEYLRPVWRHAQEQEIADPGAFPVAPDLVEALVELGELDEARTVTARLERLSRAQAHPWGLAAATRCRALVRLTTAREFERAAADLVNAADMHAALGLRFEAARAFLFLGRTGRTLRKWGTCRSALESSAAGFEEIGSVGWAAEARAELARIGGRRARAPGSLTESEQRIVELASTGLSNKEIAQTVFVTVPTVERHLSHAYAKLGVRSRAQLAARVRPRP